VTTAATGMIEANLEHRDGVLPSDVGEESSLHESAGAYQDSRPIITITTEELEVNAAAARALSQDDSIYQRGGFLVRVVRDASPAAKKKILERVARNRGASWTR
jgi:hypothetical protein